MSVNAVIAPLNWVGGVVLSEALAAVPTWRSVVSTQCPPARRQAIWTRSPVTKPALDGDFEPSLHETVPFAVVTETEVDDTAASEPRATRRFAAPAGRTTATAARKMIEPVAARRI